jgi:putative endonuclease
LRSAKAGTLLGPAQWPRSSSKRPCEKSSHYSVTIVRTGITRRLRTARSIRNGWRLRNFVILAGSIRGIKKLNNPFGLACLVGGGVVVAAGDTWSCYMVRCADGSLYVGIAIDPVKRAKRHNWGIGSGFTGQRRPVKLIWSECCGSSAAARRREEEIKGWSRSKKLALAERFEVGSALGRAVGSAPGEPFEPAVGGFSG